jgi:hypothetical protein
MKEYAMSLKQGILRFAGNRLEDYAALRVKMAKPAAPLRGEAETGLWYKIPVEGGIASDGSGFFTYVRRGSSNAVAVFLVGGGASWNEETARYPSAMGEMLAGGLAFYIDNLRPLYEYSLFLANPKPGIFTADDPHNPFKDWSFILLNYATADFHVGSNDLAYRDTKGRPRILHHRGYQNAMESLKAAKRVIPRAGKLLITGGSAGAFAVPALASDIMARFPECADVTVYADSALVKYAHWPETARTIWKSPGRIASAVKTDNITLDWFRMLMGEKGASLRYLYSNSTHDAVFAQYQNYIDTGVYRVTDEACGRFYEALKEHVAELKKINPQFGIFINNFSKTNPNSKGTEHCILSSSRFSEKTAAGVSAMDWLWDAVNGKVYDAGMELLG